MEDNPTVVKVRRPRTMMSLPQGCTEDELDLAASFVMDEDAVQFANQNVRISKEGLTIDGNFVGTIQPDHLSVQGDLGRGACCIVRKAQHILTRGVYAVKVFATFEREKRNQLLHEIVMLHGIDSPSLISFYGAFLQEGSINVILEFMDLGSLKEVIHDWKGTEYDESVMAAAAYQMLWGLAYLHYERRLHRDIKPQNILLNTQGEVKLGDFGIAKELPGECDLAETMVGTIRYMSPERLLGEGYGPPGDIWSLGVLLLEMATRQLPFMDAPTQIDLHSMLEELQLEDLISACDISEEFREVLRGCLQLNPAERLTADELLDMPWFTMLQVTELDQAVDVMLDWLTAAGQIPAAAVKRAGTRYCDDSSSDTDNTGESYTSDAAVTRPNSAPSPCTNTSDTLQRDQQQHCGNGNSSSSSSCSGGGIGGLPRPGASRGRNLSLQCAEDSAMISTMYSEGSEGSGSDSDCDGEHHRSAENGTAEPTGYGSPDDDPFGEDADESEWHK